MSRAYRGFSTLRTSQSRPIPGSTQVPNSAGGFAWEVDKWTRLERFLILGAEGGTYYIGESKLVEENCQALVECVTEDGLRTLDVIYDVRLNNRNVKQDPVLFAWAYCLAHGDLETRRQAARLLYKVAKTGRQLFTFCEYALQFRSWGPILRRAVANWYLMKDPDDLAFQVVKYRSGSVKGGSTFTHKRLLNVSHPNPEETGLENVLRWVHGDMLPEYEGELPRIIEGFEKVKKLAHSKNVANCVREYSLPWEAVPTEMLNKPLVLEALLEKMPVMATMRQLPRLTAAGVLKPGKWDVVDLVVERLKHVHEAGIHPMNLLVAMRGYESGESPNLEWTPVEQILEALDDAFYLAFDAVVPTGKTIVIGLDCSASMDNPYFSGKSAGGDWMHKNNLTPRECAACMAMVTARVEHRIVTVAFDTGVTQFQIRPRATLSDVVRTLKSMYGGGTDCAIPMLEATRQNVGVDCFIVYTDNETWAGSMHPSQALKLHRNKCHVPNSKLIVVGMCSNGFTIADPNDKNMLDVVGFDTSVPAVMSDFITA